MSSHVISILTAREEFMRCLGKVPTRVLVHPKTLYEIRKDTSVFQYCEVLSTPFRICGLIVVTDSTLEQGEVLVA
ncbi:MAG: hypothetical protein RSE94_03240 [Pseudomonas sp.]